MPTIYKLFIELVSNLFLFHVLIFFVSEACGILVPWTGIEPASSALEGKVLSTEPQEVPPLQLHSFLFCPYFLSLISLFPFFLFPSVS